MVIRHSLLISYILCSLIFQAWLVLGGSVCPTTFQTIQNTAEEAAYSPCHMSTMEQSSTNQAQNCPQTGHCQLCQIVALSVDTPVSPAPHPMVKITRNLPYFYHFIAPLPQRPPRFIA